MTIPCLLLITRTHSPVRANGISYYRNFHQETTHLTYRNQGANSTPNRQVVLMSQGGCIIIREAGPGGKADKLTIFTFPWPMGTQ
jgi:hypothetical protein